MTNFKRAQIISVGTYVPENVVTNKDLEKIVDTSDEWIIQRTGIKSRHIVPSDQKINASELGAKAAALAMDRAGIGPDDVHGIICATFTPDSFFPSTACRIQALLGCKDAFAFDMSAACAGFVYALTVANGMVLSGQGKNIIVVGAEVISRTLDWKDRSTCILFGDGAGAVVLQGTMEPHKGILSSYLVSDGTLGDILELPSWGENRTMRMKGNEVFKHAVRNMSDASTKALNAAGLGLDEVDYLIPHQANIRIIQAVSQNLNIPSYKVVSNLERYGNTSSASIPIALDEIWNKGGITDGKRVLITALGGGIVAGSAVISF
ncbi:MAG TPA: beta-ketoacyl-ACP synthase III [Chitinispirillaceae bacterium]|nr:beta-ketoacyl-ACP synthase III [Chitinispirillaceae bacterium]